MYDSELPDFADTVAQRKEAARKTLRPASNEELLALGRELFPDGTHPWAATFSQFVEEHKAEPAVRGETFETIGFVYYPRSNRGIWYQQIGDQPVPLMEHREEEGHKALASRYGEKFGETQDQDDP